jgi:DNA-binding NtrC family response regulator
MTTCLYFDDEEMLLALFRDMFGGEYDVRTALTLAEARRELSSCSPEIIISDWSMPEISGVEFLREAAKVCPGSFRFLLTGRGHVGDFIMEVAAGIVQFFMPKPWAEEEMREALGRAVADRRSSRLRP